MNGRSLKEEEGAMSRFCLYVKGDCMQGVSRITKVGAYRRVRPLGVRLEGGSDQRASSPPALGSAVGTQTMVALGYCQSPAPYLFSPLTDFSS